MYEENQLSSSTSAVSTTHTHPSKREKTISTLVRIYGILTLTSAIATIVFGGFASTAVSIFNAERQQGIQQLTLTLIAAGVHLIFSLAHAVLSIIFSISLLKNKRHNAARYAYALVGLSIALALVGVMLLGFKEGIYTSNIINIILLLVVASTLDPQLMHEREISRHQRNLELAQEVADGTLGRAKDGKGYIQLNFFNLFWVFTVSSFLGLIIEVVYHMTIVAPGQYQDRAGLLFGPFSPIYGFGASLMTIALNRYYKANPAIIFLISAIIGGTFESATSWYMQVAYGAKAWDYSHRTLFGMPDPLAVISDGRTCTLFMLMWGALGFVWIRLCLPAMLRLINMIPWRWRYSVTTICTILMLINGIMTMQALECWYERESGISPSSPVEVFYAEHFDNETMANRFQTMTITPRNSVRVHTH